MVDQLKEKTLAELAEAWVAAVEERKKASDVRDEVGRESTRVANVYFDAMKKEKAAWEALEQARKRMAGRDG